MKLYKSMQNLLETEIELKTLLLAASQLRTVAATLQGKVATTQFALCKIVYLWLPNILVN